MFCCSHALNLFYVCKIYLHSQQLVTLSEGQRFCDVWDWAETSWFQGQNMKLLPAERWAPEGKGLVLTLRSP